MKLQGPITGVTLTLVLLMNTLFCWSLFLVPGLLKLIPLQPLRNSCDKVLNFIAITWFDINNSIAGFFLSTQWQVELPSGLSAEKSYLVSSNHQSWVDIIALVKATSGKVPFFRFFLKEQLKYVPLLGFCWWALDYPFMKRYSKDQIAQNPSLAGKDIETTRRSCERFKGKSTTIVNFLEGTRFSAAAHQRQHSPYQRLLKPKAGGMAFVLQTMGEQIDSLLDVTILYPQGVTELWDYLCGRQPQITVIVTEREIPNEFIGRDYKNDEPFRDAFQAWLSELWQEKDQLIQTRLNP